ncbi:MAG: hypothetical protein FJY54_08550 [Betaproteobacteria bacterium]|nr:hypothetical protein [Betaproteobacteria bacterium]
MGKHAKSVDSQVIGRITANGPGWVFTPADFLDLGSRVAIGLALMRHARAGTIRQLARGLYDYPIQSPRFGAVPPSDEAIANALKGRDDARIQASGAYAANVLGLSTQVPVRSVFLTDGRTRRIKLGKRAIVLKNTSLRQMATAGRISGTVIQALRWIGQRHIDDRTVASLRRKLADSDKQQLLKDLRYAPAWIAEVMRKVAQPEKPA